MFWNVSKWIWIFIVIMLSFILTLKKKTYVVRLNLFNVVFWKSSLKIYERKVDKMEGRLFCFIVIVQEFYFLFQPIIINLGPTWSLIEHNFLDLTKLGLLLTIFLEHKVNLAAKNLYWCNIKVLMIIKVYQNIILVHLIP